MNVVTSQSAFARQEVRADGAPLPIGAYSQAIRTGNLVFLSAQAPISAATNTVEAETFEGQLKQSLDNLVAVAEAAGGSLALVTKVTALITDFANFPVLNTMMESYFSKPYPARTTASVVGLQRWLRLIGQRPAEFEWISRLGVDCGARRFRRGVGRA